MVSLGKLVQQRLIPGAYGGAVGIKEGQYLKVIDVQGKQVCDFFAFNPEDPRQFLSGSHTRVSLLQTQAKFKTIVVGRPLLDNSRQPMLLVEEDTVGVHDWLMAPCDEARYSLDFGIANHRNCKTNSLEALEEFNLVPHHSAAGIQGRRPCNSPGPPKPHRCRLRLPDGPESD
jgi:uncharacterized protein YcgI (DUF1989 family)